MNATVTETQYEQLVRAGREAREQADSMQWVEGDLALQIETLPTDERPRDPETGVFIEDEAKTLKRYAEDIDVNYSTLRNYRAAAKAWPIVRRRTEVGFEVHKILAAQEDRFDLIATGMTKREAKRIVRERNGGMAAHKPGWFELLGAVGDTLTRADKELGKAEYAIEDPNDDLRAKAAEYAEWADDLAERLRVIAE